MKFRSAAVFLLTLLVLAGCGGKDVVKSGYMKGAPVWVVRGSGAFDDAKEGKVFYGVGMASGIGNHALLRSTAENRARNELAKIFETYSASLMKDYMASTSAADPSATAEEQHVEQAVKTVTSVTLSGGQIVDHWLSEETGELFALARISLEDFKKALAEARELNAGTRDYIRENADRLHEELRMEEDRAAER